MSRKFVRNYIFSQSARVNLEDNFLFFSLTMEMSMMNPNEISMLLHNDRTMRIKIHIR